MGTPYVLSSGLIRLLITGIPGTGKTTFGDRLAANYKFIHDDLEMQSDLADSVREILKRKENNVVTWGFVPSDPTSVYYVQYFRNAGFKLVWFDGNRPAALRAFLDRESRKQKVDRIPEICFYAQMHSIEESRIIERLTPTIINPFDECGKFKETNALFKEIKEKAA